VLFDGKDLTNWVSTKKGKASWLLVDGAMQVQGGSIRTKKTFAGPYKLHVEFRVPTTGGSNSGVYVQGRFELQVINGYGKGVGNSSCGSVYNQAAPLVNACKAPGVWQSFDIEYVPPTCEDGKLVAPALLTVLHNGVKIHDKVKLEKATGGSLDKDVCAPGPLMLQDHGAPVQYRNIWLLQGKLSP
jgi:hypothetical protein